MEDVNQRISEILSDPQSMQQIQSLMSSLGMNSDNQASAQPAGEGATGGMPDLSMLSGLLGSLNGQSALPAATGGAADDTAAQMAMAVSRMAPLMQKMKDDDDSTRLLKALRPLLSMEKQAKLDESLKIMQLMRMMPLMKNSGLLSGIL